MWRLIIKSKEVSIEIFVRARVSMDAWLTNPVPNEVPSREKPGLIGKGLLCLSDIDWNQIVTRVDDVISSFKTS